MIRARFDRAQENLFEETRIVEGEAMALLGQGKYDEAGKRLSDHTYVALDLALKEAARTLNSLGRPPGSPPGCSAVP